MDSAGWRLSPSLPSADSFAATARAEGNSADARRRWLKEQGILQESWFYTEREEARRNEADELIKIMGIGAMPDRKATSKPKSTESARDYKPSDRYETERGMGLRFEDMKLPEPFELPDDDMPDFSPADLRLPPEALYKKMMSKRGRR